MEAPLGTGPDAVSQPLRIGILGAANIARAFVDAARASPRVMIRAVASRDPERGRKFADELGIEVAHGSYEALLADPMLDAVYNPLPNNLHAEWSIRAADAGKHVLCEKPLATSAAEARAMFEAARRNSVFVVEGYPYRAQPQTLKLRELLAEGAIGPIQTVHAAFGFPLSDPSNIRMDPALGGGALMDAGSYPVSLVRMIAGERPTRVQAAMRWTGTRVDRTLAGTLEFPSGLLAQIACSFATARHRRCFIVGDAGTVLTTYFNDTGPHGAQRGAGPGMPAVLEVTRGSGWDAKRETIETASAKGFLAEAEAFADLVAHGMSHWTGATPEESIDIALTLDALAQSARTGVAVQIQP
jgi:D-xylose 1-dehydrogenase (NADP+, D-xylono-1,5-lactone-forming)